MEVLRKLRKNKWFMIGLLIPLIFQLVYLCLAIPAIKDGNSRMQDLKITVVNEDSTLGKQISAKISEVLPFQIEQNTKLNDSLDAMNNGETNMVLYIAADFSTKIQQGEAQVSYYINQAAPSMTKQAMERVAVSINQTLNENLFNNVKDSIQQNSTKLLSQSGLPDNVLVQIGSNLNKALDSLKYTAITGDIEKVNNADGFSQTVLPFFIFLTYFVGCIAMTGLHNVTYKPLIKEFSRSKILLCQFGINIMMSLVVPSIVIALAAGFDIPFNLGIGTVWLILSTGFFTLLYTIQLFANWFGIPGMGVAAILLFPLQLVTSGLIYSKEILPSFYTSISNYLPASYFGDGMLKIFYGGPSISKDIWILLLMSAICIVISAFTVFKKEGAISTKEAETAT